MTIWYLVLILNGHRQVQGQFPTVAQCMQYRAKHPLKIDPKQTTASGYICTTTSPQATSNGGFTLKGADSQ